jgi:hypothetical protein
MRCPNLFTRLALLSVFCGLFFNIAIGQVKPMLRQEASPSTDKSKFWLFLLAGQSNMAGRGAVEAIDTMPNVHVLTLNKDGEWEIAKDPIHFDRTYAGVGPGLSFGKDMAKAYPAVYVGLIPCAVGGSSVTSWQPDNAPKNENYLKAIERCKKAMETGTLKGIIWHQGETDCTAKGVTTYEQRLINTINGFRKDLGMPALPFIAGELPAFQMHFPDKADQLTDNPYVPQINQIIAGLKAKLENYDYVKADSTDHRGDRLHFNSASARLMGKRYAVAMKQYLKK